uniref:ER membrane protein complex subunit 7 beta-sandwich domain-containing protein n=1 Tax=Arcella intermedia TaxID=1963864 RepID=A0A6B2LKA5_9EUKA
MLLVLVALLFGLCWGESFVVEGKIKLKNPNGTPPTANEKREALQMTTLYLNSKNSSYVQHPNQDGKFSFEHLESGSYLLQIISTHYKYDPLRVDVNTKQNGKITAFTAQKNTKITHPFTISPTDRKQYFEEVKQFNVFGFLFQNIFMVVMLGMVVVMFVLQKLAGPEAMKELYASGPQEQLLPNFLHTKKNS